MRERKAKKTHPDDDERMCFLYFDYNTMEKNFVCLNKKSARRDSNPRPRPWQGRTPPTEPLAHVLTTSDSIL